MNSALFGLMSYNDPCQRLSKHEISVLCIGKGRSPEYFDSDDVDDDDDDDDDEDHNDDEDGYEDDEYEDEDDAYEYEEEEEDIMKLLKRRIRMTTSVISLTSFPHKVQDGILS